MGSLLRRLLFWIGAALALLVLTGALFLATRREPAIDGSKAGAAPLPVWSTALVQALFDLRVWSGARSGYIALFAREGEIVFGTSAGWADVEGKIPMTLDTRVRIASLTKPITAVAAMSLVEDGILGLDDPVSRYLPAAATLRVATSHTRNASGGFDAEPLAQPLLVRHLLLFASGLGGDSSVSNASDLQALWLEQGVSAGSGSLRQRVERALALPLFEQPGSAWRYGGSADVLAHVLEVAAGKPFPEILHERVFEPLGMRHTEHLPPPEEQASLARIYTQDENGDLVLVTHRVAEARDWTPGGGGLVSTVGDYMRFGLMMRNGGVLEGTRVLAPETVAEMTRPHLKEGVLASEGIDGLGWGLGMAVVVDAEKTLTLDRDGDFWWAGYFGTFWSVSPDADLVGVVYSQNEPGPYSDLPLAVHTAMGVLLAGL